MRNLLAFLGAAILTFAFVGWYLDWYRIKSSSSQPGHQELNINLNRAKIVADVQKGVQKGEERIQDFLERSKSEGKDDFVGPIKPPGM